jgi:hypothetical protein
VEAPVAVAGIVAGRAPGLATAGTSGAAATVAAEPRGAAGVDGGFAADGRADLPMD